MNRVIERVQRHAVTLLLIIFLFCLGAWLRLQPTLQKDLWFDEVSSVTISQAISVRDLFFQSGGYRDFNHPSYYYLGLKLWMSLFSNSELAVRGFSLVFFLPTGMFVFLLGRKLYSNTAAVLALALFVVHPQMINLGFQARMFAMTICFTTMGLYFLACSIEKPNKRALFWGTVLSFSTAFYSDNSAFWIFPSLGVWAVWLIRIKSEFISQVMKVLLYSCLLCLPQVVTTGWAYLRLGALRPGSVPQSGINWEFVFWESSKMLGVLHSVLPGLAILVALSCLFLAVVLHKRTEYLFLLVVPLALSLAFSLFVYPIFLARHLFIVTIAMVMLLVGVVETKHQQLRVITIVLLCSYIGMLFFNALDLRGMDFAHDTYELYSMEIARQQAHTVLLWPISLNALTIRDYYLPRLGVDSSMISGVANTSDRETVFAGEGRHFVIIYTSECIQSESCLQNKAYIESVACLRHHCNQKQVQ